MTTAGSGVSGFDAFFDFADKLSPLGNADAESCCRLLLGYVLRLPRKITMQNLFHDGGFSSVGMTESFIESLGESSDS